MAYNPFDYTPIVLSSDSWGDIAATLLSNLEALVHMNVASGSFLSWDWEMQDSDGTHPPTDPFHPGQDVFTNALDTQEKVKLEYVWSGDLLQTINYYHTTDGGTIWDPMGTTQDPLGKVTLTYSTVPGATDAAIKEEWT